MAEENAWRKIEGDEEVVRTCAWSPPGCHPVGCGVKLHIKDGKLVKVEGDETHPITQGRLCVRCLTLPEYIYHPDRILTPLYRDPKDRGKDKWNPITWDEALDIIEEKVNYVKENWGPESQVVLQGTGRESTLYASAMAYACLGTPNQSSPLSGQACYGPRCTVADFLLGAGYPELDYAAFFPDRYDDPRYEVPKYIILWGKDPLFSNPDGFFGHAIIDLMKRGTKLITIDPRVTWLGVKAEYHLQLRPGTDAAVGLGLLHVVIGEDLYDHEFVEKWCFGFEDLAERVKDWTPERVAEVAWVDPDALVGAARAFATNAPSSIMWGLALDTATNGVQASQTLLDLAAICGYMDVPGGITLAVPASFMGKWRFEIINKLPAELKAKKILNPKYLAWNATATQAHDDAVLDALETDKPYPVKLVWIFSSNPLACCGVQPKRWLEALKRTEFNVVQDVFMTPTAMGACDLFLPLATYAEHDGVVLPHFGRNTHFLGAMNKAIEVGDCKSDIEICIAVGKRLNPAEWPWDTAAEFFTAQIKPNIGLTFEELQDEGIHMQSFEYRKYETGGLRPDGEPGFNTTTGLIELKSTLYPDWNEDALPYFEEPFYSPYSDKISDEEKAEYPLVLTTGGRVTASFHSEHRQIPSLRAITPDAIVEIHPETAAKYGIEEGDWVCMENSLGRASDKAHLPTKLDPRVVHAHHGWWYPEQEAEEPNLYGVFKSAVNELIPHDNCSVLGWGAPYKNVICKIYKVNSLDD